MSEKYWGGLNCPHDSDTIIRHLSRFCGVQSVVLCELGVDRGYTGNRMVDFLKEIAVENIVYYGVDTLDLDFYEKREAGIFFEHSEMKFVQGNRDVLHTLQPLDFGFIDACHCAECVYLDSVAMSQIVKLGGCMGFHDTSLKVQYPYTLRENAWQHYESGTAVRPLNVVEGITMGRAKWHGDWRLITQDGDKLDWGGIRVYQRVG
jgi:hypothetical protein